MACLVVVNEMILSERVNHQGIQFTDSENCEIGWKATSPSPPSLIATG